MTDPLEWLWPLADAPVATIGVHHTTNWPDGVLDQLLELGLLVESELATRVLCPECQNHSEEVLACEGPGRTTYAFIACPELHRVRVSRDARRQWSTSFTGLASTLASRMKLTGKVAELATGRVWRLGRMSWQGTSRDVVLARGLHWRDAAGVRGAITRSRKPVVFVPRAKPPAEFWSARIPAMVTLDEVAMWGEAGLEIDSVELLTTITFADAYQSETDRGTVNIDQMKLLIRQQVKAENKSELTDDIFLQAYRQHGSVRRAAEFLSNQTGTSISKDQVQRAVRRAGGVTEVLNAEHSDSVIRPVASQFRDKNGRPRVSIDLPEEE